MSSLAAALLKAELFSDLSPDIIQQEILPHGYLQEYQKQQFVIIPQEKVEYFGVVITGKVQIMHLFIDGKESLMSNITAGGCVGADLVCTKSQISPYHAVAAIPTQIFYLPISMVTQQQFLPEDVRLNILGRLLTLISNENIKKEYRLAILSQKALRDRITTYLTMQVNRRRTKTFTIPFTRDELASFLCVNRSVLSHELSRMQQEGLISFRKNVFTVHYYSPDEKQEH